DIKVGESFVRAWRDFKCGPSSINNEAARLVEQDIERIFDVNGFQLNAGPDDRTLQLFINGKSFKLNEVGSGMSHFILVLANAALKKPSYILIDEPELGLHPSLQVEFITALHSYASCGVIFSTHSIGLARAVARSIYLVRRIRPFESEIKLLEVMP